jgi:hypothetical protein
LVFSIALAFSIHNKQRHGHGKYFGFSSQNIIIDSSHTQNRIYSCIFLLLGRFTPFWVSVCVISRVWGPRLGPPFSSTYLSRVLQILQSSRNASRFPDTIEFAIFTLSDRCQIHYRSRTKQHMTEDSEAKKKPWTYVYVWSTRGAWVWGGYWSWFRRVLVLMILFCQIHDSE